MTATPIHPGLPIVAPVVSMPAITRRAFRLYKAFTGPFAGRVNFDAEQIGTLYQQSIGTIQTATLTDPTALAAHAATIKQQAAWTKFNTSYVALDIERFGPGDPVALSWYLKTIDTYKSLYPGIEFGFFPGLPNFQGDAYARPEPNVYKDASDKLRPLWDKCGAFFPECYVHGKHTLPTDPWTPQYLADMTYANSRENRRIAGDRPVIVFGWVLGTDYLPLSLAHHVAAINAAQAGGANGYCLWEDFKDASVLNTRQAQYDQIVGALA